MPTAIIHHVIGTLLWLLFSLHQMFEIWSDVTMHRTGWYVFDCLLFGMAFLFFLADLLSPFIK